MKYILECVKFFTGRDLSVSTYDDAMYAIKKGSVSVIRGYIWCLLRFRKPNGLMLGGSVRILDSKKLKNGKGVFIGFGSYLDCSTKGYVTLSDGVTMREGCWVQCRSGLNEKGDGLYVGENTYIGPYAILGVGGPISIGRNTQIGGRLTISAESHLINGIDYVGGSVSRKGVKIGRRCWLGNNVTVLDGVVIGDGCVIGAGAVVTKDIPCGCVAYGVPAAVKCQLK